MAPIKNLRFLSKEKIIVIIGMFILFCADQSRAQIGIGLPAGEEPQSALDVRFDSAVSPGFLMPRVNSLPTGDIADGMLVYYTGNSEDKTYYVYYNGTWTPLAETAGIVPPDTRAPTAPSSLTAGNPSSSTIDLSWTASTDNVGVSGYKIYFNDGTLATTSSGTSVTVTGLVSNTAYTFYATAYDAAGNESTSSNTASETTSEIGCEALTVCNTSFEEDWGCWTTLYSVGGNASVSRVSGSAQNGVIMVRVYKYGGIGTSSTDLSSYGSLDINFWYRTSGYSGSDKVIIQYSSNGSDSTTLNESSPNNSSSWAEVNYSTSDPSVMSSSTYIRIIGTGSGGNDYAFIDNTTITANCP
jgi:hypothetical protein